MTGIIQGLVDNGSGPVVLVGHSLGGVVTLNAIGETNPGDLQGAAAFHRRPGSDRRDPVQPSGDGPRFRLGIEGGLLCGRFGRAVCGCRQPAYPPTSLRRC